jgi:type IV secretory pathway ATPase VirB11/archaellum biosynthesis ATPase
MDELSLAGLVANGTMSEEIAATLRGAAKARRSFIVAAVPRLAGKSTVMRAMLAERPNASPLKTLAEDGDDIDRLLRESNEGYLVIPEITQSGAMPGYVWGAPVRRIFKGAGVGVAVAATLHAEGPEDAFAQICAGSAVPDADASKVALAVQLRSIGRWETPTRRVVETVHAVDGVKDGTPRLRLLHRWDERRDRFV